MSALQIKVVVTIIAVTIGLVVCVKCKISLGVPIA